MTAERARSRRSSVREITYGAPELDWNGSMTTRAVSRAFEVLETLAAQPRGLRLHDLSCSVGLHKSTVFRLVRTLVQLGYVQQAGERDRYALSPAKRLVDLGHPRDGETVPP